MIGSDKTCFWATRFQNRGWTSNLNTVLLLLRIILSLLAMPRGAVNSKNSFFLDFRICWEAVRGYFEYNLVSTLTLRNVDRIRVLMGWLWLFLLWNFLFRNYNWLFTHLDIEQQVFVGQDWGICCRPLIGSFFPPITCGTKYDGSPHTLLLFYSRIFYLILLRALTKDGITGVCDAINRHVLWLLR